MQAASRQKLQELEQIISNIPLEACCVTVLPEFGVRWRDVSRAVRNSRLPMRSSSVARVLCRHATKTMLLEDLEEIVAKLRLKLVVTQDRKWYVIELEEPLGEEMPVSHFITVVPGRIAQALKKSRGGHIVLPEIETALLGDLLYVSVQIVSRNKTGPVLYVATPPGQPVALVSSVTSSLLKGSVEGLGYKKFKDALLFGKDVQSLLRIYNQNHNENVNYLANIPIYNPMPMITANGIDYTNKTYDEQYVDNILGPNPPLLTELMISTSKSFFDKTRLDKKIKLNVQLKTDDVAKVLKGWVSSGAISPTSDFFQIFHKVKANKITFQDESDDD